MSLVEFLLLFFVNQLLPLRVLLRNGLSRKIVEDVREKRLLSAEIVKGVKKGEFSKEKNLMIVIKRFLVFGERQK